MLDTSSKGLGLTPSIIPSRCQIDKYRCVCVQYTASAYYPRHICAPRKSSGNKRADTMSLPPLKPDKTAAGIILDPQTLERVVPQSRRADGT